MTDDKRLYHLSRRSVLAGIGGVGLASAGAGLGTSAFLNDRETFENSTITAGTLDLLVDYYSYWNQGMAGTGQVQGTQDGSGTISGELGDVKPGDNGLLAFCPRIETNPAYLWLCGEITANSENGYTEPEPETVNNSTMAGDFNDPGVMDGAGELAESIEVTVSYCDLDDDIADEGDEDDANDGFDPSDVTSVAEVWTGTFADLMTAIRNGVPLDGGASVPGDGGFHAPGGQSCFVGSASEMDNPCLCLEWHVPTEVGNEIQGDSLSFDLEFHAEQCRNNDGTHNPCAGDGGEPTCEPCELPTDVEESPDVQISSVDASSFPEVSTFLRVDTTAGNNGDLTAADFEVCENGLAQDESVSFTSGSKADIVFVFDDTGSMYQEIEGAKNAIGNFVDDLSGAGIDARFALISFKDTVQLDQDFTANKTTIQGAIDGLGASGGGDGREDNFDGIGVATRDIEADQPSGAMLSSYRSGAQRVIIDITDAPAQVDDPDAHQNDSSRTDYVMSEVEDLLEGFTYIAVSSDLSEGGFSDPGYEDGDKQILANNVGGTWFELPASSSDEFSDLLIDEVGGLLTTTYTVTYTSCDDDGEPADRDIWIEIDDPDEGALYKSASFSLP